MGWIRTGLSKKRRYFYRGRSSANKKLPLDDDINIRGGTDTKHQNSSHPLRILLTPSPTETFLPLPASSHLLFYCCTSKSFPSIWHGKSAVLGPISSCLVRCVFFGSWELCSNDFSYNYYTLMRNKSWLSGRVSLLRLLELSPPLNFVIPFLSHYHPSCNFARRPASPETPPRSPPLPFFSPFSSQILPSLAFWQQSAHIKRNWLDLSKLHNNKRNKRRQKRARKIPRHVFGG